MSCRSTAYSIAYLLVKSEVKTLTHRSSGFRLIGLGTIALNNHFVWSGVLTVYMLWYSQRLFFSVRCIELLWLKVTSRQYVGVQTRSKALPVVH